MYFLFIYFFNDKCNVNKKKKTFFQLAVVLFMCFVLVFLILSVLSI